MAEQIKWLSMQAPPEHGFLLSVEDLQTLHAGAKHHSVGRLENKVYRVYVESTRGSMSNRQNEIVYKSETEMTASVQENKSEHTRG